MKGSESLTISRSPVSSIQSRTKWLLAIQDTTRKYDESISVADGATLEDAFNDDGLMEADDSAQ
jgi:hypothetical protein